MITIAKARQLRRKIEQASISLPDADAIEAVELFPRWEANHAYAEYDRVSYENTLYKCVQAHTSQADWTPDATPALWTEVAAPGEIPVWKQPTGAQDAYMTGDKVYYPAKGDAVYISIMDYNTYAPDVYGWELDG